MNGKSVNFEDEKINKSNSYKNKKLFNIHDLDVNKILISKKESHGTKNSLKYFIGYNDDDAIRSQILIAIRQSLSRLVTILKKYNKILEKISNLMNIEPDSGCLW